jgi:hypothetical protein
MTIEELKAEADAAVEKEVAARRDLFQKEQTRKAKVEAYNAALLDAVGIKPGETTVLVQRPYQSKPILARVFGPSGSLFDRALVEQIKKDGTIWAGRRPFSAKISELYIVKEIDCG